MWENVFQLYSVVFFCRKKKGQGKILHFMPFKFWQTLRQGHLREISDLFSEKNIIKYVKIHKRVGFIICPLLILKERMVYEISMGYSKYRSTIGCTPPPALAFTCFQLCQQGFSSLCIAMMAAIFHAWCGALCPSSHSLQTWKPPMSSSKTWISAAQRTVLVAREMLSGLRK